MMSATAAALSHEAPAREPSGSIRQTDRQSFHANVRALPLDGRLPPAGGIVVDLCQDGLFVSSVRQLPPDALVLLLVYSPFKDQQLRLLGRVVHCREGEGFGCRFLDLDYAQRRTLQDLVSRI